MATEPFSLFLVHLSYILPVVLSSIIILLILVFPDFRKDKSKIALLFFLIVWLINLLGLLVWELFLMTTPNPPVCDFFYYYSGLISFPFIYNYFITLMTGKFLSFRQWTQWYIVPVLLLGLWLLTILIYGELAPVHDLNSFLRLMPKPEALIRVAAFTGYCVYSILVILLTVKRYVQYKEDIANDFSFTKNISREWIFSVLVLFLIFAVISVMAFATSNQTIKILVNYLDTLLIGLFVILGLRYKSPYSEHFLPLSGLKNETADSLPRFDHKKKFTTLLENEKIWMHSNLSAEDVVRLLGTNRTYFSRFIKVEFDTNFRTLINQYRIKEAKSILEKNPTITIADLCQKTGFSSISSFNLWFHKETNLSPSEYKTVHKKNTY